MEAVQKALAETGRMAVMLSGGLDSAVLAQLAYAALGDQAIAITLESPIVPWSEIEDAARIAREIGMQHEIIPINELEDREFTTNQPNRCYVCRKLRNRTAREVAAEYDIRILADGMNYDDLSDYRPGKKASDEDGIWHPFIEHRLTKKDIRALSRTLNLSVWEKPSEACLCSRIAYGIPLNRTMLTRIEKAETFLKTICRGSLRVRAFPYDMAMIETADPEAVTREKDRIVPFLRELGFAFVSLDLEGFVSGKLNRIIL